MRHAHLYKLLASGPPENLFEAPPEFTLYRDKRVQILWAPFDHVNTAARVVLVGITPGWQQAAIGYRVAADALAEGHTYYDACRRVKTKAAFAGSMRRNLVRMLDELGLNVALSISSTSDLFQEHSRHLVQSTSALRYPVFVKNGMNYSGYSPDPLQHKELREMVESVLADELSILNHPLVVPFGKAAAACVKYLRSHEKISCDVLEGFPHPSGANGHRIRQFETEKVNLQRVIEAWANST